MEKNVIIFLDVDGVLNKFDLDEMYNDEHIWATGGRGSNGVGGLMGMFKSLVDNFKLLYDQLAAECRVKLVLSSSWRNWLLKEFNDIIIEQGFHDVEWDITPYIGERGEEIKHYLDNTPLIPDYVIIIDDEMFDITEYFKDTKGVFLLKTDGTKGLLKSQVVAIVELIKERFDLIDELEEELDEIEEESVEILNELNQLTKLYDDIEYNYQSGLPIIKEFLNKTGNRIDILEDELEFSDKRFDMVKKDLEAIGYHVE